MSNLNVCIRDRQESKSKPANEGVEMPIYEYACSSCCFQYQSLIIRRDEEEQVVCPHCGSKKKRKLISRVAYHVSEQDRLNAFKPGDEKDGAFFRDSRNIGLAAKKRARELGVDLGSGFEDKLDKLRTDPGSVLRDSD